MILILEKIKNKMYLLLTYDGFYFYLYLFLVISGILYWMEKIVQLIRGV